MDAIFLISREGVYIQRKIYIIYYIYHIHNICNNPNDYINVSQLETSRIQTGKGPLTYCKTKSSGKLQINHAFEQTSVFDGNMDT